MPCIYLIHQDPEVYPEPERFRPERFLGDAKPSSRVWLPFGAGSRHCVGSHLALMTIKSVIRIVLDPRGPRGRSGAGADRPQQHDARARSRLDGDPARPARDADPAPAAEAGTR